MIRQIYAVARAEELADMIVVVLERQREGWKPQGGITVTSFGMYNDKKVWAQAMVKNIRETKKPKGKKTQKAKTKCKA
jgi:hypothetical protein